MQMEETFEKLRTLQEILSARIKLEKEVAEIPKVLVTHEELLARLKKTFIDKNNEFEKAKENAVELREQLLEAESMREKSEKNMDLVNTQREYEALDKEIKDATEKEKLFNKELQKEEHALAELEEAIKQNTALIENQEKELAELRSGIEAEIAEKTKEINTLEDDEKALTSGMDEEVLFKFERIIRNKMGKGIVAIKGGVCTGCHMVLPVQFANMVHLGEEIVFCPYCSRILYYEESEEGEEEFYDNEDSGALADLDDLDDEEFDEDDEEEEKANAEFEE
jgi:predicted  nucleic acid-binding Zn-ribbon protein